jgi:hypothetical protein
VDQLPLPAGGLTVRGLDIEPIRPGQQEALEDVYRRAPWASHTHHPRYAEFVPYHGGTRTTLVGWRDGAPQAYANVFERGSLLARVLYGPVFTEPDDGADFIIGLVDHYRRRGFHRLEVQLNEPAGWRGESIAYRVARECRFTSDVKKTRTVAVIPLSGDARDGSESRLSKGHKWSVKKARRLGLHSAPMTASDVPRFADLYVKMFRSRRLPIEVGPTHATLAGMFAFLDALHCGLALKVCGADGSMLGGLYVIREEDRALYYLAATDPDLRQVPIIHVGILDAITWASQAGCTLFDLGGYYMLADPEGQEGKLNLFKDGFRSQPLFFTRAMRFALSPVGGLPFDLAMNARRLSQRVAEIRPALRRACPEPRVAGRQAV